MKQRRRSLLAALLIWMWPMICILALVYMTLHLQLPSAGMLKSELATNQTMLERKTNRGLKSSHKLLGNLDMPTRRVRGRLEPCLKLRDEDFEIPDLRTGKIRWLEYITGDNSTGNFTGDQSMLEREQSYKFHPETKAHCGFYSPGSGFDVDKKDQAFMDSCELVVSTAIFGAVDMLYQPIGMSKASLEKVCYVAFLDDASLAQVRKQMDRETSMVGLWRVVRVGNLPFSDNRRNGKIPKLLGHRLFPNAKYSIWVDSKSQFRRDPLAVFDALLWAPNASLAISLHGGRSCVYQEGDAVIAKHKARPSEVRIQLSQYRKENFPRRAYLNGHKALAEASVIVREHSQDANLFMCQWFNEVSRFTARDQLSFPYVLMRSQHLQVNMFPVCTRRALVNSMGHKPKK